jgi:hypothetical protein
MPFLNTTVYFCDEKPVERRIRKRAMAKIQNFLFFADILRFKPVDGISGKKIGVIDDIFAIFEQTYPCRKSMKTPARSQSTCRRVPTNPTAMMCLKTRPSSKRLFSTSK